MRWERAAYFLKKALLLCVSFGLESSSRYFGYKILIPDRFLRSLPPIKPGVRAPYNFISSLYLSVQIPRVLNRSWSESPAFFIRPMITLLWIKDVVHVVVSVIEFHASRRPRLVARRTTEILEYCRDVMINMWSGIWIIIYYSKIYPDFERDYEQAPALLSITYFTLTADSTFLRLSAMLVTGLLTLVGTGLLFIYGYNYIVDEDQRVMRQRGEVPNCPFCGCEVPKIKLW